MNDLGKKMPRGKNRWGKKYLGAGWKQASRRFLPLVKSFFYRLRQVGKKFQDAKSLGLKIGGSFTLLMVISIFIAITGFVGMNRLAHVFNQNQITVSFVDQVYQIGGSVKDYQRTGASEDITKVNDLMRELESERKKLTTSQDADGLEDMWKLVVEYQKSINSYALLKDRQDKFFNSYLTCESQGYRLMEEILTQDQGSGNVELEYELKTKITEIGLEVRGFVVDGAEGPKKEAYSLAARQKLKEAEALALTLKEKLQGQEASTHGAQLLAQIKSLGSAFEGITEADGEKVKQMAAVVKNGDTLLKAAKDQMVSGARQSNNTKRFAFALLVCATGVCFVAGMILAAVITRGITKPILTTVNFAQEISRGNLSIPDLTIHSRDEVSVLGQTLNEMKDNLNRIVTNIQDHAGDLAAASEQMLSCARLIAEGSQNQSYHLTTISAEVKELAGAAERVSNNAQNALTTVQEAKEKAQTGEENVSQAVFGMRLIHENMERSNKNSLRIGEIIKMIDKISGQTNLLALNAAIEAARAGTIGRGFGVVAQEVKKLADSSRKESQEIGQIVFAIQKGNLDTEKAVKDGSTWTERSGQSFQAIASLINLTVDKVNEITDEAQNQAIGSGNVVSVIEEVSLEVEQTAAGAQEMLATVEELGARAEQLRSMVLEFHVA